MSEVFGGFGLREEGVGREEKRELTKGY